METVAGKVGQAVAQRAVKSWLEERRKSKERTASLAELAAAELSTVRQRKRLEHLAEGIGHQVGDQLEPLLETKFSALPDNEVRAALDAVVDAIDDADLSDEAILDADADPEVLARRIRQQVPNHAGLSELATRLHDLALDQACRYLVQVIRQLPAFQPRALAEVLGRATAQTAQLDEILARLPRTSLHAPQGAENDEEFRGEYLRYIANALDRLELLGLSMRHRPRLSLSVAYLSLTVSEPDDDSRNGAATADKWFAAQDDHRRTRTRVESALTNRTLVRGDAGSGKTTLLDWLAVTAAQGGFTGRLREWNGCVPLPIRLRRYADSPLPAPEQFLDETAKWLVGLMPPGWVHRSLRSGEALVLVDGVDELRPAKRNQVREWLRDLDAAFPETKVVVTSRPAAADERWLTEQGFSSVLLEQMGPTDVKTFLGRWHDAARDADALPCPVDALPAAQRRLMNQLDSREHLRALAANPLLCAMLCALNLGRTSQLPQNRMELYQAALSMLLELRDAEREITGLLSLTEKSVLLRDLAWRLTLGNRSQLSTAKAREHVERKVRSMPNTTADPGAIVAHLLERSGVVREPVPGQVDFVHRTFQEYLAAAEAIQDGQIEALVAHAHLDSWWETVVMACGHAHRNQVGELLTGILDRADAEPSRARRLRLLAAACLETVTDVDAAVHDRVDQVIRDRLVPPRSLRETASLASIGHRVLHYLPTDLTDLSVAAAESTVRTVALTATPEAMSRLACYASDPRPEIQRELAMAWQYFDPERYAHDVLADAPLVNGSIWVDSRRFIPHLPALRNLTCADIWLPNHEPLDTLEVFAGIRRIELIRTVLRGDIDVTPLLEHQGLRSVLLFFADSYTNLAALGQLPELVQLYLWHRQEHADLGFLENLPELVSLSLGDLGPGTDLSPFGHLRALEYLSVDGWPRGFALTALPELPKLGRLRLGHHTAPDALEGIAAHLTGVAELTLVGDVVTNLAPASEMPSLERLVVLGTSRQTVDLRPLAGRSLQVELSRRDRHVGLGELGDGVRVHWIN
ncbi:NACHT domain-containing protein [Saccharopolyspora sp. NPDC003752]